MADLKLVYWKIHGRALCIRLAAAIGKVNVQGMLLLASCCMLNEMNYFVQRRFSPFAFLECSFVVLENSFPVAPTVHCLHDWFSS